MDTNLRIRQLMEERRWTEYKLAKEANLSQSTIANLFKRNTVPSITTLEAICSGFGITLAQFFAEGDMVELTREQQEMFRQWAALTDEQKALLSQLIKNMR
ncbi:MAG: helix-turn-helix transcriptional regulator [Clostridia bacterium]|nr:helix-turn-helix transcriptional regulator [Clostridia bacterium]